MTVLLAFWLLSMFIKLQVCAHARLMLLKNLLVTWLLNEADWWTLFQVARGRAIIPANKRHTELEPTIIGARESKQSMCGMCKFVRACTRVCLPLQWHRCTPHRPCCGLSHPSVMCSLMIKTTQLLGWVAGYLPEQLVTRECQKLT